MNRLANECLQEKPQIVKQADRIASLFLSAVLMICLLAVVTWSIIDPNVIFQVVLSILIAACPCALSLATPSAVSQAIALLRTQGIWVNRHDAIEKLNQINHVVFDKTGTLTHLLLTLDSVRLATDLDKNEVIAIASALEHSVNHPIATTLHALAKAEFKRHAEQIKYEPQQGIKGVIDDNVYFLGSAQFVSQQASIELNATNEVAQSYLIYLAQPGQLLATIGFRESLVMGAENMMAELPALMKASILSGDSEHKVNAIASYLKVNQYGAMMTPESKLNQIKHYLQAGDKVLMIGDGSNDYPAQSKSFLSATLPHSPDISRINGDILIFDHNLAKIPFMFKVAHKTDKILRQGFSWSIGYNVFALGLAFAGMLSPLIAALGMSLSSMIVVGNTLRLKRLKF